MRTEAVLVTGAAGEMGQALIRRLADEGRTDVVALDASRVPDEVGWRCRSVVTGDVLDETLLEHLASAYAFPVVYHLAALLSTRAEHAPEEAHRVNVDGTLLLLRLAARQSGSLASPVEFLFPSSVAVYGLPDLEAKARAGAVKEPEWNAPATMYGCTKLACEHLGRYYARHYRQLDGSGLRCAVDFRAIRFPGLISASTTPTGGTSDYAPEMLHSAAQGRPYACFVREDTRMPFMAMPDAIEALVSLERAPAQALTSRVYNVAAFSLSAAEVRDRVRAAFPDARIAFRPDPARQAIVDSWPADMDDGLARRDWGFRPAHDAATAFERYLVPGIRRRYAALPVGAR